VIAIRRSHSRRPITSGQAKVRETALQPRGVDVVRFANNGILIEMTEAIGIPPKWQHVADPLSEQPPQVCDLFRYLLVMSMVDEHKAKIVGARAMRGRHYLRIKTNAGNALWTLRPLISMATELRIREEVKAIIEERDD
jgi:hypothetical protein